MSAAAAQLPEDGQYAGGAWLSLGQSAEGVVVQLPVTPAILEQLAQTGALVDPELADDLGPPDLDGTTGLAAVTELGCAVGDPPAADRSITDLRAAARARTVQDAQLVRAVAGAVLRCRDTVLARHGWACAEQVPPGRVRRIEAEVRRAAVAEVEMACGFSLPESTALVGMATAGPELRELVTGSLERGETTLAQARLLWTRATSPARDLTEDQVLLLGHALLGDDPALAVPERLDQDGRLRHAPFPQALFDAALTREVIACQGSDVSAERERRRRAYASRRASIRVHDDGTATLSVTGPAASVAATHARIDHLARTLRAGGEERTLDQLRTDTILALLLHGTLDLPTDPDHLDELTPTQVEELLAVIHATPAIGLQVLVPHDVLGLGHPVCATCATQIPPRSTPPPEPDPPWSPPEPGYDPDAHHGRGQVGEILGPLPLFITPGHARELFYTPGTTLHRLLVDPADGRCVERTITSYRPDADMRRQVLAADRYSRAPGSRLSGRSVEIDHVIPFGTPGGVTCELNLGGQDKRHHQLKTLKLWAATISTRRDITFTTLLGQITTTRTHDYRQYLLTRHPEDLDDRRDLANTAVYAALAAQPEHQHRPTADAWLTLTHTDPRGERRPGPAPGHATLDDLLGITQPREEQQP